MANNNNLLFNAAIAGFTEAAVTGRQLADFITPDSQLTTLAVQFATAVDAQIAFDALITTGMADPTQLAPSTKTIAANQECRFELMKGLCFGAMTGRYGTFDPAISDFTGDAVDIVNVYNLMLSSLVTP
jgi:hypothetical protein